MRPLPSPAAPAARGIKRITRGAAVVFWGLAALSALAAAARLTSAAELGLLALTLPLCWAGVDLLSAVVHWSLDTYGSPRTPLLGPIIADFREHHGHPEAILEKDFLDCCASAALLGIPLLLSAHLAAALLPAGGGLLLGAMTALTVGGMLTNYIHRIAHAPETPATMRALQRVGLILSPTEHARHHSGDHRAAYAITSGWSNRLLERTRLLERIEGLLSR